MDIFAEGASQAAKKTLHKVPLEIDPEQSARYAFARAEIADTNSRLQTLRNKLLEKGVPVNASIDTPRTKQHLRRIRADRSEGHRRKKFVISDEPIYKNNRLTVNTIESGWEIFLAKGSANTRELMLGKSGRVYETYNGGIYSEPYDISTGNPPSFIHPVPDDVIMEAGAFRNHPEVRDFAPTISYFETKDVNGELKQVRTTIPNLGSYALAFAELYTTQLSEFVANNLH